MALGHLDSDKITSKILTDSIQAGKSVGVSTSAQDAQGNYIHPSGYDPKKVDNTQKGEFKQQSYFVIVDGQPATEMRDVKSSDGKTVTPTATPIEITNTSAAALNLAEDSTRKLMQAKAIGVSFDKAPEPTDAEKDARRNEAIQKFNAMPSADASKALDNFNTNAPKFGIKPIDKSEVPKLNKAAGGPDPELLKGKPELQKLGIDIPDKEFVGGVQALKNSASSAVHSIIGAFKIPNPTKEQLQYQINFIENHIKEQGNNLPTNQLVHLGASLADLKQRLKDAQ